MAAEYRGIFLAARSRSSVAERAQNEFIRSLRRRTSASPGRTEIRGTQFSAQFRLDLSDIGSPARHNSDDCRN